MKKSRIFSVFTDFLIIENNWNYASGKKLHKFKTIIKKNERKDRHIKLPGIIITTLYRFPFNIADDFSVITRVKSGPGENPSVIPEIIPRVTASINRGPPFLNWSFHFTSSNFQVPE